MESDGTNNETIPVVDEEPSTSGCTKRKKNEANTNEEYDLKIKLLRINYYSKQLECREREINLGLPPSKFTSNLYYTNSDDEN